MLNIVLLTFLGGDHKLKSLNSKFSTAHFLGDANHTRLVMFHYKKMALCTFIFARVLDVHKTLRASWNFQWLCTKPLWRRLSLCPRLKSSRFPSNRTTGRLNIDVFEIFIVSGHQQRHLGIRRRRGRPLRRLSPQFPLRHPARPHPNHLRPRHHLQFPDHSRLLPAPAAQLHQHLPPGPGSLWPAVPGQRLHPFLPAQRPLSLPLLLFTLRIFHHRFRQ